jgi:hypothetical protein
MKYIKKRMVQAWKALNSGYLGEYYEFVVGYEDLGSCKGTGIFIYEKLNYSKSSDLSKCSVFSNACEIFKFSSQTEQNPSQKS